LVHGAPGLPQPPAQGAPGPLVEAVLLDAVGTLIQPREPVAATYGRVARRFGVDLDPAKLSRAFNHVFGAMPALAFDWSSRGELYRREREWWRDLVRRVLGATGSGNGDFERFFETLYLHYAQGNAWECFPDVLPALTALRAEGCKLGVVSNFDSRLPGILRALGIWDRVDAVVYSSEARSAKPDPGIFSRALSLLGVGPERTVHVGDCAWADVAGAAAAGITGYLIRRNNRSGDRSGRAIRSLEEFFGIVRFSTGSQENEK